jgi:Tol biopolymer transport system component
MKTVTLIILLIVPMLFFTGWFRNILLDMQVKGKTVTLSNPVNISNHKGYDNQPFFSLKEPILYFTSDRDTSNTDIKIYNYQTGTLTFLTNTPENEYSPTVTPDGKFISCIIARKSPFAQDLGKYPVNGGEPVILFNNLVVGYHAWIDDNRLLLFVLDGNGHNSLHYYDLLTKEDKVLAQNPGRALRKIPGQYAMSFVDKTDSLSWKIKKLDIASMQISDHRPNIIEGRKI